MVEGSPMSSHMKELLQKEAFRKKVAKFIAADIHSDITGANGHQIKAMKKKKVVSYSRPVDPKQLDYLAHA
jgi:hypothetical protein